MEVNIYDFQGCFGAGRRWLDRGGVPVLAGLRQSGADAIDNIREAIHLWLETEAEKQMESLPANARTLEVTI